MSGLLVYKPAGKDPHQKMWDSASKKYYYVTGIIEDDKGDFKLVNTSEAKVMDQAFLATANMGLFHLSHTAIQDNLPFYKAWDENHWLYVVMDGNWVNTLSANTPFKDVRAILDVLSYEGAVTFLEFICQRNSKGIAYVKSGNLVVPNLNLWDKKEENFTYGVWETPVYNYNTGGATTAPRVPTAPRTPLHSAIGGDMPECVELHGIYFAAVKPGMGHFFGTKGKVYVDRISPQMKDVIDIKVREMDIVTSVNGKENISFHELKELLSKNNLEVSLKLTRYFDQDPSKSVTLHRVIQ